MSTQGNPLDLSKLAMAFVDGTSCSGRLMERTPRKHTGRKQLYRFYTLASGQSDEPARRLSPAGAPAARPPAVRARVSLTVDSGLPAAGGRGRRAHGHLSSDVPPPLLNLLQKRCLCQGSPGQSLR